MPNICLKMLLMNAIGLTAIAATPVVGSAAPEPVIPTEPLPTVDVFRNRLTDLSSCNKDDSAAPTQCLATQEVNLPVLDLISGYARGQGQSSSPVLNQIDVYLNEGSKDEAIAQWRRQLQWMEPMRAQSERYTYEGSEHEALDILNRVVTFTQLDQSASLDWTNFGSSNPEENSAVTNIAQVTAVAQLTDIRPTDWAFAALQSLVERYGIIQGYPNKTFRGDRALTRYEFAAGLNAALDRVNELVASGATGQIRSEDFENLEKLQEEFKSELTAIRTRLDGLEGRVARLETERFSFTSKLFGLAFFNVTGLFGAEGIQREVGFRTLPAGANRPSPPLVRRLEKNPNITSSALAWLTLASSFTGQDLLFTQLAAGRGISPANAVTSVTGTVNSTGIPFTDAGAFLGPGAPVVLRELAYEFPVFGDGKLAFGPRINWFRFFDLNPFTFFLTGTTSLNAIANPLTLDVRRGAGAILFKPLSPQLDLRVGYLAESNEYSTLDIFQFNSASSPREGLFGGTNALTAELTFKPTRTFNFRFNYTRQNHQARRQFLDNQVPVLSPVALVSGAPINGLADDGFGGSLENAQSDIFGVNLDWFIARRLGLFARYGFANTRLNAEIDARDGNIKTQSFQVGFALVDLFRRGAQATFAFLIPFDYTSGRQYLVSGGGDGATQYELEGTYFLPLTQNISIVPSFQIIFNANNFSSNPTIGIFNLRTQFTF